VVLGGIAVKFGRLRAAAIGGALGIFVSGSAGAVTVNIEYTGTVTGCNGGDLCNRSFIGQSYVANYVFDLAPPNPKGSQLGNPVDSYVFGGTLYGPTSTSPALLASITIGASTFTIPQTNSYLGYIEAYTTGFRVQYHVAYGPTSNAYLYNSITDVVGSSLPTTIDVAFPTYTRTATDNVSGDYCNGTFCYLLAPNTLTETVNSTPLPAALPLFGTGLGALGLIGWRRKRKQAA